jgi:hypothetical protein
VIENEIGKLLTFPRHKIDRIPHTNHQTRHDKILHDDVHCKEISLGCYKIRHNQEKRSAHKNPNRKIPQQTFSSANYWISHNK